MSISQPWPLSQHASKSNGTIGTCSICFATHQLHNKDGTVHKHGPRNNPCPGPHKAPLSVGTPGCPASRSTFHTSSSAANSQPIGTAFVATQGSQVSSVTKFTPHCYMAANSSSDHQTHSQVCQTCLCFTFVTSAGQCCF